VHDEAFAAQLWSGTGLDVTLRGVELDGLVPLGLNPNIRLYRHATALLCSYICCCIFLLLPLLCCCQLLLLLLLLLLAPTGLSTSTCLMMMHHRQPAAPPSRCIPCYHLPSRV
jgi:hypothetical protein